MSQTCRGCHGEVSIVEFGFNKTARVSSISCCMIAITKPADLESLPFEARPSPANIMLDSHFMLQHCYKDISTLTATQQHYEIIDIGAPFARSSCGEILAKTYHFVPAIL